MICRRCKVAMVRVVNPSGTAHTTCNRCGHYVECARCQKCGYEICVRCYNKPPPKAGAGDPLIPYGSSF